MNKLLIALLAFHLLAAAPLRAQEAQSSHYKAAERMLNLMDMETVLRRSIDEMLKQQIAANPTLVPFEDVMRKFLMKHMSWESLKPDTIELYMSEFSESELNEMNKFYGTPTGKKMIDKMPALMAKGAQMGVERVKAGMPELEAAMRAEAERMAAAAKAEEGDKPPAEASPSPTPTPKPKPKGKK